VTFCRANHASCSLNMRTKDGNSQGDRCGNESTIKCVLFKAISNFDPMYTSRRP